MTVLIIVAGSLCAALGAYLFHRAFSGSSFEHAALVPISYALLVGGALAATFAIAA